MGGISVARPDIPRSSFMEYSDSLQDLKTIGTATLGCGTRSSREACSKAGNRVRITVQLIDCWQRGFHLWSETYDRIELDDIFAIQDEIARRLRMHCGSSWVVGRAESEPGPHREPGGVQRVLERPGANPKGERSRGTGQKRSPGSSARSSWIRALPRVTSGFGRSVHCASGTSIVLQRRDYPDEAFEESAKRAIDQGAGAGPGF